MRVLPKPSSIPQNYFQTQLTSMSKLDPSEHTKGKIQIVWNQLASGMTSNANLQPNESTSKAIFNPIKYFQKQLIFMGKLESCKHTEAKIQLLLNQFTSLHYLGRPPILFLNPWYTFKAQLQPNKCTTKGLNGYFCSQN